MTQRSYWTAVWCGFLVLTIGLGVRQSFGIFLKPISASCMSAASSSPSARPSPCC